MDTIKNKAEIDLLVQRLEGHLHNREIAELFNAVRALSECTIYSDCDTYRQWNSLKPEVIRCLFRGIPLSQYAELPTGFNLYTFDVHQALDAISEEVTEEQILALVERFGLPNENTAPALFRKLTDSPEESVTRWLQKWIEERLPAEQASGAELSQHLKTVSTFRYVRWLPDDKGLSGAVSILAQRSDPLSQELRGEYLLSLPWGEDRLATAALLAGLTKSKNEANQELLRQALAQYSGLRFIIFIPTFTLGAPWHCRRPLSKKPCRWCASSTRQDAARCFWTKRNQTAMKLLIA